MKFLIFQHSPEDNVGSTFQWLDSNNHSYVELHTYKTNAWDNLKLEEHDALIILGGSMNVFETEANPWLLEEKKQIKNWIKLDRPTLGICLGSQLLAEALGGEVKKASQKEIGFFPVEKKSSHSNFLLDWPESLSVFHWHECVFSLPKGATHLMNSSVTPNQAFSFGEMIFGFQFHPEAEWPWIEDAYKSSPDLKPSESIQDKAGCKERVPHALESMKKHYFLFLDRFFHRK
ncbi:MAG: type 1 glutamine amidotransferase [Oligoflexia bacterium]|nr:type 1 glutamine amidotransferase [Oligoflexia bacterium]